MKNNFQSWLDSGLLAGLEREPSEKLAELLDGLSDYLLNKTGVVYYEDSRVETIIYASLRRLYGRFMDEGKTHEEIVKLIDFDHMFNSLREEVRKMSRQGRVSYNAIDAEAVCVANFSNNYTAKDEESN